MLCHNSDNRESEERTLTINNVGQTIQNIWLDISTEDMQILPLVCRQRKQNCYILFIYLLKHTQQKHRVFVGTPVSVPMQPDGLKTE